MNIPSHHFGKSNHKKKKNTKDIEKVKRNEKPDRQFQQPQG